MQPRWPSTSFATFFRHPCKQYSILSEDFLPKYLDWKRNIETWLDIACAWLKSFLHISTTSPLFMTSSNFFRSLFWIDFCRGIDLFSFVCSTHCISQSFVLYFVKQEHFIVSIQFNVFGQTPFYAPITVLVNLWIIVILIYTAQLKIRIKITVKIQFVHIFVLRVPCASVINERSLTRWKKDSLFVKPSLQYGSQRDGGII